MVLVDVEERGKRAPARCAQRLHGMLVQFCGAGWFLTFLHKGVNGAVACAWFVLRAYIYSAEEWEDRVCVLGVACMWIAACGHFRVFRRVCVHLVRTYAAMAVTAASS